MTLSPDQLREHGLPDEALQPMPNIFGAAPTHESADFPLGTRDDSTVLKAFASRLRDRASRRELQKAIAALGTEDSEQPAKPSYKLHTVVNEHGQLQFAPLSHTVGTLVPFQTDPSCALDAALLPQMKPGQPKTVRHILQCIVMASKTTFALSTIGEPRALPTHLRIAHLEQPVVLGSNRSWLRSAKPTDIPLYFGDRRYVFETLGAAKIKPREAQRIACQSDPHLRLFHATMFVMRHGLELHPGSIQQVEGGVSLLEFGSGGTQFCAPWSRRSSACLQGENRVTK